MAISLGVPPPERWFVQTSLPMGAVDSKSLTHVSRFIRASTTPLRQAQMTSSLHARCFPEEIKVATSHNVAAGAITFEFYNPEDSRPDL